jgi:HD superfamily phosphohydrolase
VSNLVLVRDPDLGFVSAVKEPGLAALESYCLSRSRSHQVFVRHHKVAQIATALRHCSVDALGHITFKPMLDALESLGRNDPDSLTSYAIFDDTWWFQSLRVFRRTSSNLLTNACLDLVLDRQRTLRSVWKRKGDLTPEQRERINSKVDGLFTSADGPIALAQKRRQLLDEGILIAPFKFNPLTRRKPDRESVMLIKSANGTVPASTVSPLIAHLRDSWEQDIHLYAFVLQDNSATLNEIVSKILN